MTASAVSFLVWRGVACCGMAVGAVTAPAAWTSASAQGANPCAIYGAGFVPLAGGDTCVRIGGRVRVDGVVAPSQDVFGPGGSLNYAPGAPAAVDGTDRAHLRLQGGPQSGMPRTR